MKVYVWANPSAAATGAERMRALVEALASRGVGVLSAF